MDTHYIEQKLNSLGIEYEMIRQDKPITCTSDAEGYYPMEKSAPTFILQTEEGSIGCITSSQNGRLNFEKLKQHFGYTRLKMAD